ncbi:MAG: T9SS type A sorting domain-containing protein [Gemmatimonadaceae bacterium]|nr:T9SS type A sorting domain-containing protein [Gemmatimonadaceae bacterium]
MRSSALASHGALTLALLLLGFGVAQGQVTFDDFEDGDVSDWIFFGGNAAGGGGGAASDRPAQGSWYLDTGWGGAGSESVFYGGFFRNLPEDGQLALPDDPWLSLWVLVQTGTTVDRFAVEITVREDTDGEGYEEGEDDSFQHILSFEQSDADDTWRQVSAPLASFTDLQTGGDGTFDGSVDEVVIVISGVEGGEATDVLVDFDDIVFTSGAPEAPTAVERLSERPAAWSLGLAYPNPFNPVTTIHFSTPTSGDVELAVYNSLGQKVRTLVSGAHAAGEYAVTWDALDDGGAPAASGVYLLRMAAGGFTRTHRVVLAR